MEDVNLPMEKACEPIENACQPKMLPNEEFGGNVDKNTKKHQDKGKNQNVGRVYKEVLSQPLDTSTQLQKLQWLQKHRTVGLWVQCDSCDRWRYLPNILDSYELPMNWYCNMNPDSKMANCSIPEVPIHLHDEEDLIHSEYAAGSLVLARLAGWPWWPAMVDDCPDTEQYYWLDGFSDIPTHYNVVFFDINVTRAWVTPNQLKPFSQNKKTFKASIKKNTNKERLEVALGQAEEAEKLTPAERLQIYSFINRYKGPIRTPIKTNEKHTKQYQRHLKRKFNIDIPNNFFESDDDRNSQSEFSGENFKSDVIVIDTNKKNKVENNDSKIESINKESSLVVQVGTDKEQSKENDDQTIIKSSNLTAEDETTLEASTCNSKNSDDFDF